MATELVRGLISEAGPVRWRAGVDAGNPASARVLEKCGFREAGQSVDAVSRNRVRMFVRDRDADRRRA